jgi:hypothetical protein
MCFFFNLIFVSVIFLFLLCTVLGFRVLGQMLASSAFPLLFQISRIPVKDC